MSVVRRFLIAPSLARLVRKERGANRIVEGFLNSQQGRTSLVRVEGGQCHLVLMSGEGGSITEERTEIPKAHADPLLDACAGRATFDRTRFALGGGRDAVFDHYSKPGRLDVVCVSFERPEEASGFTPPGWFGQEVTAAAAYEGRAIAVDGVPTGPEVEPTNAALNALLDALESRLGLPRFAGTPRLSPEDPRMLDAMRRLTNGSGAPAPAPAAAPAASAPAAPPARPVIGSGDGRPAAPAPVHPPATAAIETVSANVAELRPLTADGPANDLTAPGGGEPSEGEVDSRMDDVIENLSQALGAATADEPAEGSEDANAEPVFGFGRWTVRARRGGQE